MRNFVFLLLVSFILQSCIPLRIAPSIDDYKIVKGKKFKRNLPKKTAFIFEDPKDADEFYHYINTKFNLQDYYVDVNVPFYVENNEYFLSFYEVEIPTKTLNLIPIFVDVLLSREDMEPAFEEVHESRQGNYYIALEVYDENGKDVLSNDFPKRDKIIRYLSGLKNEYLSTHNYNEVVFKN